jgi:Pentapeptide repeats (9 copies)
LGLSPPLCAQLDEMRRVQGGAACGITKLRHMPGRSRMVRILGWPGAAARRGVARASLFTSVTFAIVAGAAIAIVVTLAIGIALHTKTGAGSPAPIDVLKTALTVVAGVGGAVALVVAYRRQRDLEQGRFVERFGAAASQLGDADVAVRIAGVYAMAGVADEIHDFARRQQCIEVLCGYLRLSYDAEQGGSDMAKQIITSPATALGGEGSIERHYEFRRRDGEVRQTIMRTIAAHVQKDAVNSWSEHHFDFRNARFERVDLAGGRFAGDADFKEAVFFSTASFESCTFRRCTFEGADFRNDVIFSRSTFSEAAGFSDANFASNARFDQVKFEKAANFEEAQFFWNLHDIRRHTVSAGRKLRIRGIQWKRCLLWCRYNLRRRGLLFRGQVRGNLHLW